MFLSSFTLLLLSAVVDAGKVNKGQPCNVADNRLEVGTYQFYSDCDLHTFCSPSSNTCELKKCRIDDFPFGYAQDDPGIPPLCLAGQFCPDEEDACQPLLAVDSPCQLNRDDQCQGPPNWSVLADKSNRGLNFNGSVCLNNICMWANATAGSKCVVENTPYIAYGPGSQEFIDIVSRDNCQVGLYCDAQQLVCIGQKDLGVSCSADKECGSFNCLASNVCGKSASAPNHYGVWVYVIVAIGIFGGMFGTLSSMFFFHRKQRDEEREKRTQYWREQTSLRNNIMQMRETARASIMSLWNNGSLNSQPSTLNSRDGNASYDSSTPMMQYAATKSSGLRHYLSDDNSGSEHDDELLMRGKKL